MKRALLAVLLLAVLAGGVWAAYTRDITGDLRRDAATGIQACLIALEAIISDGIAVTTSGTVTEASAAAIAADLNELTAAPVAKTLTLVTKEVATSGTGVPLVASETFARKVILMAKKATGANTGLVYIGTSTVDATTPQQIALAPGDSITIDPGPGCKVDLATIYIDCAAANTDGVTGWYFPI